MNFHKYRKSHNNLHKLSQKTNYLQNCILFIFKLYNQIQKTIANFKNRQLTVIKNVYIFTNTQNVLNIHIPHTKIYKFSQIWKESQQITKTFSEY